MNFSDLKRNAYMLCGSLAKQGYIRWWHSFTGICPETQESRTFFIEYFVINPSLSSTQHVLGRHPFFKKRGMKPSYVMIKAGTFPDVNGQGGKQLHSFFPISSLKVVPDPFYVEVDDCFFSENQTAGFVGVTREQASHPFFMTDAGSMEWNLKMHKAISCQTGPIAGRIATALNALESFWHGEGIRTQFSGTVILDGVSYEVSPETSFGYADKHWGRNFNMPWMQFASNRLVSERTGKVLKHSALAIDGCCPRLFCFPLKQRLILQLTSTGEDFEYNFARLPLMSRCKWKTKETNKRYIWQIMAQNRTSVIKLSCSCQKELMMPLDYESPDASRRPATLLGSDAGMGTVEIYRRTPDGLKLIDRLSIENGLCLADGHL